MTLNVGDYVVVYRYKEDMPFLFTDRMKEWIGKPSKIKEKYKIQFKDKLKYIYSIEPVGWKPKNMNWNWDISVLKKIKTYEELLFYLI